MCANILLPVNLPTTICLYLDSHLLASGRKPKFYFFPPASSTDPMMGSYGTAHKHCLTLMLFIGLEGVKFLSGACCSLQCCVGEKDIPEGVPPTTTTTTQWLSTLSIHLPSPENNQQQTPLARKNSCVSGFHSSHISGRGQREWALVRWLRLGWVTALFHTVCLHWLHDRGSPSLLNAAFTMHCTLYYWSILFHSLNSLYNRLIF